MPLFLAASRMTTSKAAEEVSPREWAIFASSVLATSVKRKVDDILMVLTTYIHRTRESIARNRLPVECPTEPATRLIHE